MTSASASDIRVSSETSKNCSSVRDQAGLFARDHEPHPDCPDTLACLTDTDSRPQHTLPVILRCAILGSSNRRLTIREIYAAMEAKYPYYKTAGPTWKVRTLQCHTFASQMFLLAISSASSLSQSSFRTSTATCYGSGFRFLLDSESHSATWYQTT